MRQHVKGGPQSLRLLQKSVSHGITSGDSSHYWRLKSSSVMAFRLPLFFAIRA
jgi:hypothetical protein